MEVGVRSDSCPGRFTLRQRPSGQPWNKSWISSRAGLILRRERWEQSKTFLILLVSKDVVNNVRYWLKWSDWRTRRFGTPTEWWEPRTAHRNTSCFSREHNHDSSVFPASGRVTVMTMHVVFFFVVCGLNVTLIALLPKVCPLPSVTSKLIPLLLHISTKSLPFQTDYIISYIWQVNKTATEMAFYYHGNCC
jgi:hypothetical protein